MKNFIVTELELNELVAIMGKCPAETVLKGIDILRFNVANRPHVETSEAKKQDEDIKEAKSADTL